MMQGGMEVILSGGGGGGGARSAYHQSLWVSVASPSAVRPRPFSVAKRRPMPGDFCDLRPRVHTLPAQ